MAWGPDFSLGEKSGLANRGPEPQGMSVFFMRVVWRELSSLQVWARRPGARPTRRPAGRMAGDYYTPFSLLKLMEYLSLTSNNGSVASVGSLMSSARTGP